MTIDTKHFIALPKRNFLITGATGFIGRRLVDVLFQQGHEVTVLSRNPMKAAKTFWHKAKPVDNLATIGEKQSIDVVINLAGAPLAAKRWNSQRKQEFFESRIGTTTRLVEWIGQRQKKPEILLSGSAIGYYGAYSNEVLSEGDQANDGFSHQLCKQWEQAAQLAEQYNVRVLLLRTGIVLGNDGGSLPEMLKSIQFKLAVHFGDGRQYLSWIERDDYINALLFLVKTQSIQGAVNMTAPHPVTNYNFTDTLKRIYGGWLQLPMPDLVAKLLLGEMAQELLLSGQRVVPQKLQQHGFIFRHPELTDALVAIQKERHGRN